MWITAFALPHTSASIDGQRHHAHTDAEKTQSKGEREGKRANIITTSRERRDRRAKKLTTVQVEEFGFFSGLREHLRVRIMLPRFDHTDCDRNVVVRQGCASGCRTISHREFDPDGTAAGSLVAASSSTREKNERSTRVVPCDLREGSQPGRARHGVKPMTEIPPAGRGPLGSACRSRGALHLCQPSRAYKRFEWFRV